MLANKDLVPIGVKFKIGVLHSNSPVQQFSDLYVLSGYIKRKGKTNIQMYGKELDCDYVVTLNASNTARMVDYDTVFYIDEMPTNNIVAGNSYVTNIFPEYNGKIVVALKRKSGINYPRIYYALGDKIYEYQMNFDNEKLVGYIPKNALLPFDKNSKIWVKTKPTNIEQKANLVRLTGEIYVGLGAWYSNFKQLTFEAINA